MKKIVIFYSKTAGGHLRTAEAIADSLKRSNKQLEIVMLDALEFNNFGFKLDPAKSFGILSTQLLPLYNMLYLLTNNFIGIKVLRIFIKLFWGAQFKKMIEYENPDLIITTHHFISPSTIETLNKKYPFITVVTDIGKPHRIWFDKKTDKIITPTPELAKLAKILLRSNDDQIINLGYPLDNEFKPILLKEFTNNILIIGGGSGAGRIVKQVRLLIYKMPEKKIIVVCGFNKGLFHKLSKIKHPRVSLYQFTDNIFKLMSDSDLIITKAGPGTIIEAAQMRKPIIITDYVGIQERGNIQFVEDNNLGIYCPNLGDLPKCILKIYQDYPKYTQNSKNWNGLENIVKYLNDTQLQS